MRRGPRAQAVAVLVTSPVALADDTAPIWATGTHRSTTPAEGVSCQMYPFASQAPATAPS